MSACTLFILHLSRILLIRQFSSSCKFAKSHLAVNSFFAMLSSNFFACCITLAPRFLCLVFFYFVFLDSNIHSTKPISNQNCFNLINIIMPTILFEFILMRSSDIQYSICFCYKLTTSKIFLCQRVVFAHIDRSFSFYFINLSISQYIELQLFFLRHTFARRYSSLGSNTILFI